MRSGAKRFIAAALFALLSLARAPSLHACPLFDRLIDFNCDLDLRVAVTGDSLVRGYGDVDNGNRGGYVLRVAEMFPEATVMDIGVSGATTMQLLSGYKQNLRKQESGPTQERTRDLDLLIIDIGRNDYWAKTAPALTVRNIKRLVKLLRSELRVEGGSAPFIAVATLTPSTRLYQQPFIEEVNRLLLLQRSKALPVYVRFDLLDKAIVSSDGLHPTAQGYELMAQTVKTFFTGPAQQLMAKERRDLDKDRVYDLFEPVFGTDPRRADSDADGLLDGDELFSWYTDPQNIDTDEDGLSDAAEIRLASDPLMPDDPPH